MPVFYRVVKSIPAAPDSFITRAWQRATNSRGDSPDVLIGYHGLSVMETADQAIASSQRWPRQGRYVVAVDIPNEGPISYPRTGRTPGHHDLLGTTPEYMVGRVVGLVWERSE